MIDTGYERGVFEFEFFGRRASDVAIDSNAYLGVSRSEGGDFLSTEDVELLVTLAGYVGIAIENASLYRELERKVHEYERLKEFSENIVESINVGILAVDLADRVESWNTQLEQLTGIRREKAVGRTLYLFSILPFEITSLLLTVAIVGAVVVAKGKI